MILDDLIKALEAADPDKVVPIGFENPHSWRGNYAELAFEPAANVTVRSMLEAAWEAEGTTYEGWKGGDYTMSLLSDVHLAERGDIGEPIGPLLLRYMLGAPPQPATAYLVAVLGVPTVDRRVIDAISNMGDEIGVMATYDPDEGFETIGKARLIERGQDRQRLIYAAPLTPFDVPEGHVLVPNVSGAASGVDVNFAPGAHVIIRWVEPVAIRALVVAPSPWPDYPATIELDAVEAMG